MRGVSAVFAEMLLIGIAISLISMSFVFYMTTLENTQGEIGAEGEKIYCQQSSNFIISNVSGSEITLRNAGGTKIDLGKVRIYINEDIIEYTYPGNELLEINEERVLTVSFSVENFNLKVTGDCNTGDEYFPN